MRHYSNSKSKGKQKKKIFLDFIVKGPKLIQIKYISFMNIHLLPSPELNKKPIGMCWEFITAIRGPSILNVSKTFYQTIQMKKKEKLEADF
jgi:hypothetical protein